MRQLLSLLSPWVRTSRLHYWLIVLTSALVLLVAINARNEVGWPAAVAVIAAVQLVGLIATLRRLHDAGWSRWWLALYLFPMTISWDLMHFHFGTSTWSFVDVSGAIRLIPVVIGLLAPSRPTANAGVAQPRSVSQASAG